MKPRWISKSKHWDLFCKKLWSHWSRHFTPNIEDERYLHNFYLYYSFTSVSRPCIIYDSYIIFIKEKSWTDDPSCFCLYYYYRWCTWNCQKEKEVRSKVIKLKIRIFGEIHQHLYSVYFKRLSNNRHFRDVFTSGIFRTSGLIGYVHISSSLITLHSVSLFVHYKVIQIERKQGIIVFMVVISSNIPKERVDLITPHLCVYI